LQKPNLQKFPKAVRTILIRQENSKKYIKLRLGTDWPPEQYFTQELDHFNEQDQRVWQQRYFVNDTFWNSDLGGNTVKLKIFE
jgi:hypothetical protein